MDKLLVCGNLNIDRILEVDFLPLEGQSTPVRGQKVVHGGCGGNIAIAASRLGVHVSLSSVVGKDFDEIYLDTLERSGVGMDELVFHDDLPSPSCTVLSAPEGKQAYAFMIGAMADQSMVSHPSTDGVDLVHIATSDPEFSLRTSREFKKKGIPVGFDPGQEIYFRWKGKEVMDVLENSDRFFGNLGEWEYLLDIMDLDWKEKRVGRTIYPHSEEVFDMIDEAVVTLGRKGSLLIDVQGARLQKRVDVGPRVDHTGAGDAFRGAFYAALMKGYDPYDALKFGNAMGAVSITVPSPHGYTIDWEGLLDLVKE